MHECEVCKKRVTFDSYRRHHRNLPHQICCASLFVGKEWTRHQRENPTHQGQDSTPPPLPKKDKKPPYTSCECGVRLRREHMPKHRAAEHILCPQCNRLFLRYAKRRRKGTERMHVCVGTQQAPQPSETLEVSTCRNPSPEYETKIRLKLEECYKKVADPEARWLGKMKVLRKMLPENEAIVFAQIGTTPFSSDCDVLSLSDDGMEQLLRRGAPLTIPILRKAKQKDYYPNEDLMKELVDRFGADCSVNVGDPSSTGRNPTQMPLKDVVAAMKGAKPLPGGLPFTLLDLKLLARLPPIPTFLDCRRFRVTDLISDRLESETGGAGKQRSQKEVDLASSKASSLWAQDGGFTGMHTDLFPGWIHLPRQPTSQGFKVWILPARNATQADFEEQGEDWAPEVRVLVLEPGDCLVMPTPTPHAVLTVGDTWMHHGTFIDLHNIPAWMDSLIRIAENPNITNEPIPVQLIRGWHHLQNLFYEHVQNSVTEGTITKEDGDRLRSDFTDREARLQDLLSCACPGPKCNRRKDCPCKESAAFDRQCNPWCGKRKGQKRRRGR